MLVRFIGLSHPTDIWEPRKHRPRSVNPADVSTLDSLGGTTQIRMKTGEVLCVAGDLDTVQTHLEGTTPGVDVTREPPPESLPKPVKKLVETSE